MSFRRIRVVLVVTGVLLISFGILSRPQKETPPVIEAVAAATDYTQLVTSTVPVKRAALRPTVVANGVIQGRNEVIVKARASGVIESIDSNLGAFVEQGHVLVTLDKTIAQLSVNQVERQTENARKALEVDEQLYERGALSLSALNQSRSTVDGLEAQLARAQDALKDTTIVAPIAGYIADQGGKLVVGDTVQAGQQIVRIIDLAQLSIPISLGQSQIFSVRTGADAIIEIVTPSEVIRSTGKVQAISAGSDSRTGSWTVLVDFENPDPQKIKSGISAKVTVENREAPQYPLVPNAAIVNREGQTYVYVKKDTAAELIAVKILDRYGDLAAVEPVDETKILVGEEVLTSGLSRIDEDTSVVTQY